MDKHLEIFKNGSSWLRADFHLHTKADKGFIYSEDINYFSKNYIDQLKNENIKVGVITNHNKFDLTEFKELRKNAKKEEIYLISGIEFSITDGAKGIHLLIVFSDKWIYNSENENYIAQFLNSSFIGISNPSTPPYPNSNFSLQETYKTLNTFNKDYFFVLAHIDDSNGLFTELKGRNLDSFIKSEPFVKKVLGLQKTRSFDNQKRISEIIEDETKIPAYVEGSDNAAKGILGMGNGNEINGDTQNTYLKLGAFNFEAIKYALLDKKFRQSKLLPTISNGYIKSISFNGGKLDGTTVQLNHSMNNLIGIRGSGKSSILEAVRYALDIDLSKKQNVDFEYKNNLVNALLGSGGKITCILVDDQGVEYRTEKILGDRTNIYIDEELQLGLKPNAIVKKPIYFGQKDLSQIGDSLSTEYLINKLIGNRLADKKREVEDKNQEVIKLLGEIKKIDSKIARKTEFEEKQAELTNRIQVFKKHKIDKKLEKQIVFNKDVNFIKRVNRFEVKIIDALDGFIQEFNDGFEAFKTYVSKENVTDLEQITQSLIAFEKIFDELGDILIRLTNKNEELSEKQKAFTDKYNKLKEEFSKKKREIHLPNIQADDYVKYTKELDLTKAQLFELEKLSKKKNELQIRLKQSLIELQGLWHNEFEIVQEEIKKVNDDQDAIKINVNFKGNKDDFKAYLKENIRGSNINYSKIETISNNYNDLISVYNDLWVEKSNIKSSLSDNQLHTFKEYFDSNIGAFLTYRIPDKFQIIYKRRSLNEHSLGQRASALIIFLLTLKDSDLIIIDQPEDDLDNQTIYNDVIKVLKELKNSSQFIFATHNPNIPVLGDCEQIVSCSYDSKIIETNFGSIDEETIRKDIVNIMEGGKEAFNNRKRIYELWTH
ncbi:MAG: histidinol-phosphatase [Bacteroidota bacterium]|nr:histidinol-phosphatase [Bacteroidota bacterium]